MENNITETIYRTLETRTDEIMETVNQRNELIDAIKSGKYSRQETEKMNRQRDTLRQKINADVDRAFKETQGILNQYRTEVANMNRLDPAELTDDVKLLSDGIILNARDIEGMLERNSENRTMVQIILRFAKEHNIDIGRTYYIAGQEEQKLANSLEEIARLYQKWMSKSNGKEMLDKFFAPLR